MRFKIGNQVKWNNGSYAGEGIIQSFLAHREWTKRIYLGKKQGVKGQPDLPAFFLKSKRKNYVVKHDSPKVIEIGILSKSGETYCFRKREHVERI